MKLDGELAALLPRAQQALARLEVAGEMVPSLDWFIHAFVRKEAVVSSQIEGTQATLIDLLEYEAEQPTGVAIDDVREVCNYLDAIKYARGQVRSARGLPISTRLLNETHRRLMRGVRGANKQPGENSAQPELDRRPAPGQRRFRSRPTGRVTRRSDDRGWRVFDQAYRKRARDPHEASDRLAHEHTIQDVCRHKPRGAPDRSPDASVPR